MITIAVKIIIAYLVISFVYTAVKQGKFYDQ